MDEYGNEIGDILARLEKLEHPESSLAGSCGPQIVGPALSMRELAWDDEELFIPSGYVGDVPEMIAESYQVLPLVTHVDGQTSATVTVWLHSWCRRKYNTFAQNNWSKAWTTDANNGGNYVNVGELTTWLYTYWSDGNNTAKKSVFNGHIVKQ